jgi:putative hydrolase
MFTPEETQAQSNALAKLEMVLALIEGWIDQVVVDAAGDRLPSLLKLRETQTRRRATQSPTQQLFASLVGLEVSPRTARECAVFWREIGEIKAENRDRLWEDAVLLPEQKDLADPIKFLKSTIVPDDLSGLI